MSTATANGLRLHSSFICQKEAAWAITNLCLGGAPAQLDRLFAVQFLEPYTRLLASADHRAAAVVLDGLTHLLQAADRYGQVEALCIRLEEIGALDKIEALQHHENEQIYKKVVHIMDTYFAETEDQAAPEATDDQYQFAAPSGENIQF
ncbi:hypothetical protein JYU34_021901 [Plutella xylostella]|uniref:Uncharacterized protein n=1 Tax=Plutella xylostella TaxID=51655 RepID=A0ABQ7PRW2_PLUXY|nr:hypothetical protein JYU34_021901 [Plutella xylostella]